MLRRDLPPSRKKAIKRVMMARRYRATGPAPDVVEAVYERANWSCELGGEMVGPVRGVDHHVHHRRPRAAGGSKRPDTNMPSNLGLLCPSCHSDVESRRADALKTGWLVSQYDDPAQVPVVIARGSRIVYFTPDGRYADSPPDGAEVIR